MFLDEPNVERIRRLGNVTVLVSIDGLREENDARRGEGTFDAAVEGCRRLAEKKILFGIATTVTGRNMEETVCHDYVRRVMDWGAMYLWYYVFSTGRCGSGSRIMRWPREDARYSEAASSAAAQASDHIDRHVLECGRRGGVPGSVGAWISHRPRGTH